MRGVMNQSAQSVAPLDHLAVGELHRRTLLI